MHLTTLTFNFPLHPGDIPAFRAAIVEVVGLGHELFHGHDNSEQGVTRYSNEYPLIRFAVHRGQPRIVCLGVGARAVVRHLLPILPDVLYIAGRPCSTANWQMKNEQWDPVLMPTFQPFALYKWMALNKKNYLSWKAHEGNEGAREMILNRCLTGQLRALAEAVDPTIDRRRIEARIIRKDQTKRTRWHGNQFIVFNVVAETNFLPPFGLGLGRCNSFGFGEVCSKDTYRILTHQRMSATAQHRSHPNIPVKVDAVQIESME